MSETLSVNPLCLVEGHGRIEVELDQGRIKKLELNLIEGSRFFEALVKGHSYNEVHHISCRICAICSSVHQLSALNAIEDALGVKVSPQTELLRELLILGGNIESHSLHLFCLAIPDILGYPSAAALAEDHLEVAKLGLGLKKLGNEVQELTAGRAIHSSNTTVGGFGRLPAVAELKEIKAKLEKGLDDGLAALKFLSTLEFPRYASSESVFIALNPPAGKFGFKGPTILTSTGKEFDIHDYRKVCNEKVVRYSHAKQSLFEGKPFMVGSLARVALLGDRLDGVGADAMKMLNLSPPYDNIIANNPAQAVELAYSLERSLAIVNELIEKINLAEPLPEIKVRAGQGTGAYEAPRGSLYHHYELDENGLVTGADIVTPTAQNAANLEKDLRAVVENSIQSKSTEIEHFMAVTARAYDPCISCSVHLIQR